MSFTNRFFSSAFTILSFFGLPFKLFVLLFNHLPIQPLINTITWNNKNNNKDSSKENLFHCRKCTQTLTIDEAKFSLGYYWHIECLKCSTCDKPLIPNEHSEFTRTPYCTKPCYGLLFESKIFGFKHQTELNQSIDEVEYQQGVEKSLIESKLQEYNNYCEEFCPSNVIKFHTKNGKLFFQGCLKIYWDISNQLILKEDDDNRLIITRRKNSFTFRTKKRSLKCSNLIDKSYNTLPSKVDSIKNTKYNCDKDFYPIDEETSVEPTKVTTDEIYDKEQDALNDKEQFNKNIQDCDSKIESDQFPQLNKKSHNKKKKNSTIRRQCSINGHFYNRETCVFTPDQGSVTSVWLTSLQNTREVINLLLEKFKVTNKAEDFSLFIVRDNGECRRIKDDEYPLLTRVLNGPNEDAVRVFILNKNNQEVSSEVAQYLNLTNVELNLFLKKFEEEENKEVNQIKSKYNELKKHLQMLIDEHEKTSMENDKIVRRVNE